MHNAFTAVSKTCNSSQQDRSRSQISDVLTPIHRSSSVIVITKHGILITDEDSWGVESL